MEVADESQLPAATIGMPTRRSPDLGRDRLPIRKFMVDHQAIANYTSLVSLAIAGVLLFALSQIFAPLMGCNRNVAEVDDRDELNSDDLISDDRSGMT